MFFSRFSKNVLDYAQKDAINIFNMKKVTMIENYFGFPLGLPVVLVSYQQGPSSCRYPVPYSNISMIKFIKNMVVKTDWSLVELDHRYEEDLVEKMELMDTILLLPCTCQQITFTNATNVKNILL